MELLSGAEILMRMLKEEGVNTIFGYPGGAVLDLYDALTKTKFKHILVRHEQGAVHAADAYARVTGKVGTCIVTSGPGATNAVTGIATAYADSIPIVVVTGQVSANLIGNDAFQEVDIVGITRPCTKHNYLVKDIKDLAKIIKEAFYIAQSGRPGPVLIDIPKNLMTEKTSFSIPKSVKLASYNPTYEPNIKQIAKAVELIKKAKKPIIFSGGGVILSKASKELTKFAKKTGIPVTSSLMGLGAFSGTESLWLGMIGMHGTYRANMSAIECDLMIAIGVRFDDRVTGRIDDFAKGAKKIHIDIDPTSIRKNVSVDIPIVGDCRATLKKLNELIESKEKDVPKDLKEKRKEWLDKIANWKKTKPLQYKQKDTIKPQYVIESLYKLTKGDAIITTEVGQNQMWAAQFYNFKQPNHFVTSGGLGTMGFGLPAAIGAQVAFPKATVIDIAGDGSIQMNIQEMATAIQHKLPVKIVILNNGYLGMVRQWQELFYGKRYSHTEMNITPDFVKLAEAFGAVGLRAEKKEDVNRVLKEGLSNNKTTIMDFVVEKEEGVYPMVPAGKPISNMLLV